MKKILLISFFVGWLFLLSTTNAKTIQAAESYRIQITPVPCSMAPGLGDCPTDLSDIYKLEPCVSSFETFSKDPVNQHFWAVDPVVTAQGRADERARQFIYWAFNRNSIDEHPVLKKAWGLSSGMVFVLIILVVAVGGISVIVGQRSNFDFKIQVWPMIIRILALLLYVAFSATIVLLLIQLSEISILPVSVRKKTTLTL